MWGGGRKIGRNRCGVTWCPKSVCGRKKSLRGQKAAEAGLASRAPLNVRNLGRGDRTFKLCSDTTSEPGRYVKYPGGAP